MKVIGYIVTVCIALALLGMIMKIALIPMSGIVLTLALSTLSIVSLVQFIMALVMIKDSSLKVVTALMSFAFCFLSIGILFRYQWWPFSGIHMMLGTVFGVGATAAFLSKYKVISTEENKTHIRFNIMIPWVFFLVFGSFHYILSDETMYNTFNRFREYITYEEFQQEREAELRGDGVGE